MKRNFSVILYVLLLPVIWILVYMPQYFKALAIDTSLKSFFQPFLIVCSIILSIFSWLWFLFPFLVYRDAKNRMKKSSVIVWTIICVFTSLLGYLVYLLIRPDIPKKCEKCGQIIIGSYRYCPYCGEATDKFCEKCGKELKHDWKICAYCGSEIKSGGVR